MSGFVRFASLLCVAATTLVAGAQLPSDDFFPIGVHSQPTSKFQIWKDRGVNTLFQYEAENNGQGQATKSLEDWSAAAALKGLYYFRRPSDNPADDLNDPWLLAWAQKDEPDLKTKIAAANIDIYQNWKAIGPNKPVWVNFAGPLVTLPGANYTQWVKSGDWLAVDWYPINWNREGDIKLIGQAIDKLRADSADKPRKIMAYIETSWQKLAGSSIANEPTPDQFRGSVWHAIMHGANGIAYFPQIVPDRTIGGSFSYDGTPANVVAEMVKVNAKIKSYGRVLNADFNPSSRRLTSPTGAIEATWRVVDGETFFFVLNQSPNPLTNVALDLTGLSGVNSLYALGENRLEDLVGNRITDSFTPYELHIYSTSPTGLGAVVPEPAAVGTLGAAVIGWALRRGRRDR